jgi:chondroitin 4-sulfotransferase 11
MSIYFPKIKFAFVHIPKNAGSSVTNWLKQIDQEKKQTNIHDSIHIMKRSLEIQEYFAIVRNPWERLVSNYFCFKGCPEVWEINGVNSEFPSFDEMIKNNLNQEIWMNKNFKWWFTMENNQVDWIDDTAKILRYENLNKEFVEIQQHLNYNKSLPSINSSNHKHYRDYYTDETRKIVSKVFEKDIDIFKYTF